MICSKCGHVTSMVDCPYCGLSDSDNRENVVGISSAGGSTVYETIIGGPHHGGHHGGHHHHHHHGGRGGGWGPGWGWDYPVAVCPPGYYMDIYGRCLPLLEIVGVDYDPAIDDPQYQQAGFLPDAGRAALEKHRQTLNTRILKADTIVGTNRATIHPNLYNDYLSFRKSWDEIYNRPGILLPNVLPLAFADYEHYKQDLDNAEITFNGLLQKIKDSGITIPTDVLAPPPKSGGIFGPVTDTVDRFGENLKTVAWIGGIALVLITGIWAFTAIKTDMPKLAFAQMDKERSTRKETLDTAAKILAKSKGL
jgi:hypothetical protein